MTENLLVIDVGNTNTVLGVFEGKELRAQWRLKTDKSQTADEYGILTRNLFMLDGMQVDQIKGIMVASVVPTLNPRSGGNGREVLSPQAPLPDSGTRTGMAIHYDNPQEVGADRIADSVAAFEKYGGPCIVWTSAPPSPSTWSPRKGSIWAAPSRPAWVFRRKRFSSTRPNCHAWRSASRSA